MFTPLRSYDEHMYFNIMYYLHWLMNETYKLQLTCVTFIDHIYQPIALKYSCLDCNILIFLSYNQTSFSILNVK